MSKSIDILDPISFVCKTPDKVLFTTKNYYPISVIGLDKSGYQGPVVQSVVSLTSSLRVISLTVLADSI